METTSLVRLARDLAKGAMPLALSLLFCLLASVMETYGMIPALLAFASFGALTPLVILSASSFRVSCIAAVIPATLVGAALAAGSWLLVPVLWLFLATGSATMVALRMSESAGGEERWSHVLLTAAGTLLAMFLAILLALGGSVTSGMLIFVLLIGLVTVRRKLGPPVP